MVEVVRNPRLDGALAEALIDVWTHVSNAGGAVGFLPPVDREDVRATADAAFERVRQGVDDLVVAFEEGQPLAFGFLVANDFALMRHWATVKRLQRHPGHRARGLGGLVLRELEAAARDRGLERVCLTVRGGTGRERFYLAHGFVLDAVLPGRLKVAGGVVVDDLHLSKIVQADEATQVVAAGGVASPVPAVGVASAVSAGGVAWRVPAGGVALEVRRLDRGLPVPAYAHDGDAGLDLYARQDLALAPGERAVVPTGLAVAVPPGHVGLVHPRSGLAARHGLALVNAPGTIDAGYRGEVKAILVNLDPAETVHLSRGDRIAQLVVQRVETVRVVEVDELADSLRGEGGFGSTGR